MTIKTLSLIFCITLLAGCSSSPVSLQYYVLHSPSSSVAPSITTAKHYVQIQQILLPDYLEQRSLTMQTGPSTLYFSQNHVWAEPMSTGFAHALRDALWEAGQIFVMPDDMYSEMYPVISLHIRIDDFVATFDGNVMIKGQYWWNDMHQNPQIKNFDFRRPQQADGFARTVEQMRALTLDVATAIAKDMQTEN
ncbi:ABC-type transport auxiliary lipoprotein family protein [Alteromonas sp. C1M14]|uniref:PqiC family protein n=1 Tax=Alteromonas sp. C1M14 TaxID=2841567 RepID=UPI001C097558|nr:ABC-type transport auxiliary lipoprotein family protein [Alteromonas sp. C1M14]MBU2977439.1 PqiC family protein [Alteromonas sp. C1M14]